MRVLLVPALMALLFCSACVSMDNGTKRSDQKSSGIGRFVSFTKRVTKTVSEISADMLPIVGAVGKEAFLEAKSDVPKVAEEIGSQVTHFSSLRKPRQSSP